MKNKLMASLNMHFLRHFKNVFLIEINSCFRFNKDREFLFFVRNFVFFLNKNKKGKQRKILNGVSDRTNMQF